MEDYFPLFEKLWRELREFTESPGSEAANRVAFTYSDHASRRWLRDIWNQMGLKTDIDGVGNLVGISGSPPYVLLSSHTDTVPQGGHFDGILGVLAATVVAAHWTESPGLLLVDWSSEESSRFGISTFGSRLAVGEDRPHYWDTTDGRGRRLADVVASTYGYPKKPTLQLHDYQILAALELHIEQGTELYEAGVPMGVVTAIAAPQRWQVSLTGQANHSAGTPMARRHDALAAMAEVIAAVERMSQEREDAGLRTTITQISASPGAPNVIAGECRATIDVRVQSGRLLKQYRSDLNEVLKNISERRGVQASLGQISGEEPGALDSRLVALLSQTLTEAGIPHQPILSWPSHDSLPLSRHLPTAMLFVRNPSGISHNGAEFIGHDDVRIALDAYYHAVRAIHRQFQGGDSHVATE
ncbi:hydantoinase/carbamoylase family amidase [Sulfobacillus harzensis]|uniref:M20 family metallo-hydrolase n=1 Tax=Sulfobacillus harzensis TaxID=2729629 RepID=A0A7Y0Q210_9FIRM|nr:hydantoinase/carbamoylase family amidase [Sulfobacillus harzensis]NMP21406.1 M20 family metallo-hydrolase [Sulfobacillus harzensis]